MRCDLWSQQCELGAQFCELCVCVLFIFNACQTNTAIFQPKLSKSGLCVENKKGIRKITTTSRNLDFISSKLIWEIELSSFFVWYAPLHMEQKKNNISYKYLFGGKQKSKQTRKKLRWTMNVKSMLRCNFAQSVALYRFWNSTENNRKMWLPRRRKCDLYTDTLTHSTRINIIYLDRKWIRMLDFIFDKHRRFSMAHIFYSFVYLAFFV